jgi:hypothetical protein
MLLLPGEWFKDLLYLSEEQQQPYIDALAELGYMQLTEIADGAILVSPSGLNSMQDKLHAALLQVQQNSSSAAVHGDPTNTGSCLQDNDDSPQQGQGNQARQQQQQQAGGASESESGLVSGPGGGGNRQQQGGDNNSSGEQHQEGSGQSGASDPPLPADRCVRLCLSASSWPDHGLPGATCRLQDPPKPVRERRNRSLAEVFSYTREMVQLDLTLEMEACMKCEVRSLSSDL